MNRARSFRGAVEKKLHIHMMMYVDDESKVGRPVVGLARSSCKSKSNS